LPAIPNPDGPAAAAGLRPDDVITVVDGVPLTSERTLADLLWQYRAGQQVDVTFVRDGKEKKVSITLNDE